MNGRTRRTRLWRGGADLLFLGIILVAAVVIFLLRTLYLTFGDLAAGHEGTLPLRALEEGTGTIGGLMMLPWLVWVTRRFAMREHPLGRVLLVHAGAFALYTIGHTLLIIGFRTLLVPAFGLGSFHAGPLHLRLLAEAPNDAFFYVILVLGVTSFDEWRRRRARERRFLEMEAELARVHLSNLQLQLQPHFLFNALNTISSTMYDDPAAADEMIGRLGDLLRRTLVTADRALLPLREELELLEDYLALARARFGPALLLDVQVETDAHAALVPPLLLQPLVENAIRHGIAASGGGQVGISARREGRYLLLAVENDLRVGEAPARRGVSAGGMGLSVTSRRLALLHGPDATIENGPVDGGTRYRVVVRLPWRTADAPAAPASTHAHTHR